MIEDEVCMIAQPTTTITTTMTTAITTIITTTTMTTNKGISNVLLRR